MNESTKYTLSRTDLVKIGKGMLVSVTGVVAAAAALALADQLAALPTQIDFGVYQGLAVVVCSTLVNGIRKWVADNSEPKGK